MRTFAAYWWAFTALAVAASSVAAAPAPAEPETTGNPVAKARQGLDRVVSLKIDGQPLDAALDQLRKKAGVNIALDTDAVHGPLEITGKVWAGPGGNAVSEFRPGPMAPVTVDLRDVTVRTALHRLLDPHDLKFVLIGDQIVVSTVEGAAARQLRQRVTVDFDDVELSAALKRLGKETATNLVLDPRLEREAKAKVSLDLEDVSLETAVRLLAESAGLKPVRVGGVLFITDKKKAAEMRADPDLCPPPLPPSPPISIDW
jgi:hypothetical protein